MKRLLPLIVLAALTACAVPPQAPAAAPTDPPPAVEPAFADSVLLYQLIRNQPTIQPVEAETGRPLAGFPPLEARPLAWSVDGRTLAALETFAESCEPYGGGSACRPGAVALHMLDVPTWKDVIIPLPPGGWVWPAALSPDGKQLALAYHTRQGSAVLLADTAAAEIIAQRDVDFRPSFVGFGTGGASVVAFGTPLGETPGITQPGPPRVAVFSGADLAPAWEQSLPEVLSGDWCAEDCDNTGGVRTGVFWSPAVLLSHDGRVLYIVHADVGRLTTVDLAGRQARTVQIQAAQSWIERLLVASAGTAQAKGPQVGGTRVAVLSAGGTRLYATGQNWDAVVDDNGYWEPSYEWLDLLEIEAETGRVLARRPAKADELALTSDGQYLVLQSWAANHSLLVESAGLAQEKTLAGWQVTPGRRVGGQPVLLAYSLNGAAAQMGVVDAASLQVVHHWPVADYAAWLAAP